MDTTFITTLTPDRVAKRTNWEVMETIRLGVKAQVEYQRSLVEPAVFRWQAGEITSTVLACTVNEVERLEGIHFAVSYGYSTKISDWHTALKNVGGLGFATYLALSERVSAF